MAPGFTPGPFCCLSQLATLLERTAVSVVFKHLLNGALGMAGAGATVVVDASQKSLHVLSLRFPSPSPQRCPEAVEGNEQKATGDKLCEFALSVNV